MKCAVSRVGGVKQPMKSKPATCHPDRPMQARGLCKNCYNKWLVDNNPEYYQRRWNKVKGAE